MIKTETQMVVDGNYTIYSNGNIYKGLLINVMYEPNNGRKFIFTELFMFVNNNHRCFFLIEDVAFEDNSSSTFILDKYPPYL